MRPELGYVGEGLSRIRGEGLHRRLVPGAVSGPHITAGGRRMLNLCSNDYLGIPPTPTPTAQMQSSSRLLAGSDAAHARLERALARRRSQQGALVFPTGYMANLGAIPALAGRGDEIFSDELNHASIIEACRLSGASVSVYRHNDTGDLARRVLGPGGGRRGRGGGRRFIVTEGVFSMDGDLARLDEVVEIARKGGAITVVDDAHGDFVVGAGGRGTPARFGVEDGVDVCVGSLSKGLGSFGGYVASRAEVVDYLVNRSRAFIYTSALPAPLAGHALARARAPHAARRRRLARSARAVASGLEAMGYDTGGSQSHIIPIIVGAEGAAVELGRRLASQGVFAQAIRYPTVARGSARVRISVTAWLEDSHVEEALRAIGRAGRLAGII